MYSAIGFLIAACVLVAAIDQTSIREPKHLHNCPVSTLQNDFSSRCETKYPLEHFNNDFLVINNQSSSKLKEIVASSKFEYNTCFATFFSVREGQLTAFESKPVNLTCARLCPVTNDILHTFRNKRTTTNNVLNRNRESMCAFTSLFKEKSKFPLKLSSINSEEIISSSLPVNIIFLGGSVTEGYNTMYDCKEPYEKDRCEQCYGKYTEGLYRYFQSILDPSIKVTRILLTSGGWTSEVQGDKIIQNLRKQGLTSLTYRDMVFIDHSVNDDAVFGNAVQSKSIGKSLETIIRKLLLIGVGSGPNIFILNTATRVYLNSYIGMDSCKDLSKELVIKQYPTPPRMQLFSDLYNSVGDHYHIPILSYRDLVWKYNSSETVGDVDFLTGLRIAGYSELHPPWYVHQLWADLIARSIELDWEEQCTSMHDTVSDSHTGSSAFSALVVSLNHHRPSLPYLLFNASDGRLRHQGESFCLKDIAPLLDEDSADLIGSTHTHSGSNHTHSRLHFHEHTHRHSHTVHLRSSTGNASFISNGWRLVEERRKKVGWISELPPDARETMVVQNLTFPLTVDMQLPDSNVSLSELWHKRVIAVHIYALRTYFNAGSIDVHLCGSNLGSIDVLWEEYELLKVSMPELFSFMIAESNIGGGPRSVRYGFSYPHPCIDPKHPQTLVLSHKYYEDDHSIARNSTQKVKVMSVKACVVGTTDDYAAMIYRN